MGLFFIVAVFASIANALVVHFLIEDTIGKAIVRDMSNSIHVIPKMIQSSLEASIKNHLKTIAEKNIEILYSIHNKTLTGSMDETQAGELAKEILLSQQIGQTGYIYAIDSKGVIRIHPESLLKNQDLSEYHFIQTQLRQKKGYIEYEWKNPGEKETKAKALYMDYFKPWDLIISVSSYREEFISFLDINDIKSFVGKYRFGKTGHVAIIDENGECIAGCGKTGSLYPEAEKEHWQKLFEIIKEKQNGFTTQQWTDKESEKASGKLIRFQYIPEMKWAIASIADVNEINEPLDNLNRYIILSIIGILIIILPSGYFLGLILSKPLTQLANEMESASAGNFNFKADETAFGEIGDMARHLNVYLDGLESAHNRLHNEIKERIDVESQLHIFARVFESAMEGISITDTDGNILNINRAFCEITGYEPDEVIGQNPRILKSDRHDDEFYKNMWQSIIEKKHWSGEIWNRRKNGEAFPEILSISAIEDDHGETTHYVAVFHDISEMKIQQDKIKFQAYHDALTGLPNRYLAQDRLTVAIRQAKRNGNKIAVLFVDMDNFKLINDSLGHTNGDLLLQEFGKRLKQVAREQDTVARLGGDEFLIIVNNIQTNHHVDEFTLRLMMIINEPYLIESQKIHVTASIGIALYPDDGVQAQDLIKNSDLAMYQSKSENKNNYHWFTEELSRQAVEKMNLIGELREAIYKNEFQVYFQPKVDPKKLDVPGVEALIRWQKKDGRIVSPAAFIPLAEETGLIVKLGHFVLEESLKAVQTLRQKDFPPVKVAVNLSPQEFAESDVVDITLNLLKKYDLPSSVLEFEITETTMMTNLDATIEKMNLIKNQGISIAIDDFGTGYSSLYYLKSLPISTLKIDKSFIDDITFNDNDAKIVETIILMAKSLGLNTVAEGVETEEQLQLLGGFDCDLIQGYYFARPMPVEELIRFLKGFHKR